jgi:hypothetical protein
MFINISVVVSRGSSYKSCLLEWLVLVMNLVISYYYGSQVV